MYIFYGALIILSFAFAAVFPRYFIHIYKVGHTKIIASCFIGIVGLFGLGIFITMLPEGKELEKLLLLASPALILGFSTGCALMAGLVGIDGGKHWFIAIIIFGAMAMFAEMIVPIFSKFIFSGILFYGFGATLVSLGSPMEPEKIENTEEGESEEDLVAPPVKRKKLNIDWGDMKKKDDSD